jgi:hypothetical protein
MGPAAQGLPSSPLTATANSVVSQLPQRAGLGPSRCLCGHCSLYTHPGPPQCVAGARRHQALSTPLLQPAVRAPAWARKQQEPPPISAKLCSSFSQPEAAAQAAFPPPTSTGGVRAAPGPGRQQPGGTRTAAHCVTPTLAALCLLSPACCQWSGPWRRPAWVPVTGGRPSPSSCSPHGSAAAVAQQQLSADRQQRL